MVAKKPIPSKRTDSQGRQGMGASSTTPRVGIGAKDKLQRVTSNQPSGVNPQKRKGRIVEPSTYSKQATGGGNRNNPNVDPISTKSKKKK